MRSEIDLRYDAVELEFQASGLRRKRLVRGRCRNHAFLDAREISLQRRALERCARSGVSWLSR